MSTTPVSGAPLESTRRLELMRRMLADPTLTTRGWVEGWFFREEGSALARFLKPPLVALGLADGTPPAPVKYGELRHADVMHWLSAGLFEKELADLDAAEKAELAGCVELLEASVGEPLPGHGDEVRTHAMPPAGCHSTCTRANRPTRLRA